MKVIENGTIVDSPVAHLGPDETVPDAPFSVSLTRWKAEREELVGKTGLSLRLHGEDDLQEAVADLAHFERIVLEFPTFTDGRCYSFARLLRERYGWDKELRATGDVLRDQAFFMARCGIDALEVSDERAPGVVEALADFTVTYQPAADGRPPVYRA